MSCNNEHSFYQNAWNRLSYHNDLFTPIGEMPFGGSYPLHYFKGTSDGTFTTLSGEPINFQIKMPESADKFYEVQLKKVIDACTNITPTQKLQATYWGDGVPTNQWIPILHSLIITYKLNVIRTARLFQIICNAYYDSCILCWHFKYAYQIPRPVQYNTSFVPYLTTPMHPSYPAGHSVMPATVVTILSHYFPGEAQKLDHLLQECAFARLYAGVHYPLDITEGIVLGNDIGKKILAQLGNETDCTGAAIDQIYVEYKNAPIIPVLDPNN